MKGTSALFLIGLSLLLGLSQGAQAAYTNKYILESTSVTVTVSEKFLETDNVTYSQEGYFYHLADKDYVYARVGLLGWAHNWTYPYDGGPNWFIGPRGSSGTRNDQQATLVRTTRYKYDGPAGEEPGVTITPKYAGWGMVDLATCILHVPQDPRIVSPQVPVDTFEDWPKNLPNYGYAEAHGRSLGVGSAAGTETVRASTELCSFAQQPTFSTPTHDGILVYRPGEPLDDPSFPPPQNYTEGFNYFDGVAGRGIPDVLVPNSSTTTSLVYAGIIEGGNDVRSGMGDITCNRYGVWRIGKWTRGGSECPTPWLYDAYAPWPNTPTADPNLPSYQDPWYNATPATISNWWTPSPIQIQGGTANFVITTKADAYLSHITYNTYCGMVYAHQPIGSDSGGPPQDAYVARATGDVEVWAGGGARAMMKAELCLN